jgi:hypothetical protein
VAEWVCVWVAEWVCVWVAEWVCVWVAEWILVAEISIEHRGLKRCGPDATKGMHAPDCLGCAILPFFSSLSPSSLSILTLSLSLQEVVTACEPSDEEPRGLRGPAGNTMLDAGGAIGGAGPEAGATAVGKSAGEEVSVTTDVSGAGAGEDSGEMVERGFLFASCTLPLTLLSHTSPSLPCLFPPASSRTRLPGVMFAVGTCGVLGGVWRAPPIALAETSTSLAELLLPHSLAGLRAMMTPGGASGVAMAEAAKSQALRVLCLHLSIK